MPTYKDYFDKVCYKPKYFIGDRVIGVWNKIPFVGTVGNDNLVSNEEGPRVSVMLDLPIKVKTQVLSILICKHRQLRKFPVWNDESSDIKKQTKGSKQSTKKKQE